ncbi:hypothetical protein D3C83_124080 [compost metagenome]
MLAEAHAAEIVEDSTDARDNAQRLRPALESLMKADERRRRMSKSSAALGAVNAAETMTHELLDLAGL